MIAFISLNLVKKTYDFLKYVMLHLATINLKCTPSSRKKWHVGFIHLINGILKFADEYLEDEESTI